MQIEYPIQANFVRDHGSNCKYKIILRSNDNFFIEPFIRQHYESDERKNEWGNNLMTLSLRLQLAPIF